MNNTDTVLPATTQPWPYSHHSDLSYADTNKITPPHNNDVPCKITALKINPTGKKYTLPTDDELTIDLIGIAHQIELQERGFAYKQEEKLIEEAELATQAAREAAEERELQAIEARGGNHEAQGSQREEETGAGKKT
jgi:hypothetical protein